MIRARCQSLRMTGTTGMRELRHGTAASYNNLGCRCGECRTAASTARRQWVASLQGRQFDEVPHGTATGYRNWGCRCERCTAARAAEGRAASARRKARDQPPWPG